MHLFPLRSHSGSSRCGGHQSSSTSPKGTSDLSTLKGDGKRVEEKRIAGSMQIEVGSGLGDPGDVDTPMSCEATITVHTPEAIFEIPTFIDATMETRPACGCGLTCAMGPCVGECNRGIPHLITECSCEEHTMDMDAELFAGHMRNYLQMAGVDTTWMNNYGIRTRSLRTLKKLADEAERACPNAHIDRNRQDSRGRGTGSEASRAPPHPYSEADPSA